METDAFGSLSLRRIHELETLQNIDRKLSRTLELEPVLNTLLEQAQQHVPAEEASVRLYNSHMQVLEAAAAIGRYAEAKLLQKVYFHDARGIIRWVLEHKEPVLVKNVRRDLPWRDLYLQVAADTVSELDIPLLDGDEVVGVLNFESTKEDAFSHEDVDFLVTLAGQAVLAIKNAQAYEREKRLVEDARVLNEISKEIIGHLDLTSVFNLILDKALRVTNSKRGNLMIYDSDRNDLWMAAAYGVGKEMIGSRQSLSTGIVGYVAKHKQMLNVDLSQQSWRDVYLDLMPGTRSELAVPMLAGEDLQGVLNIESSAEHYFTERDERLLQGLADLAVIALQNAQAYEREKRLAVESQVLYDKAKLVTRRFELLYQAGQELGKITEFSQLEQAYDIVLNIVQKYCDGQVVISRYEEDNWDLAEIRASHRQDHHHHSLHAETNKHVINRRSPVLMYDIHNLSEEIALAKQPLDPSVRSLVATTIEFKERYYGNLEIHHTDVGYFAKDDMLFLQGLAQQLGSTIYRLETVKERQEFEQRAKSAEEMSSIGESAYEVTHRLGNDLGLVNFYIKNVWVELEKAGLTNQTISQNLDEISESVRSVLSFSRDLKKELAKLSEEQALSEPLLVTPQTLLERAVTTVALPLNVQVEREIAEDVRNICVIFGRVNDVLHNLVTNAVDALSPDGGKITLRAYNVGRGVALDVTDTGKGIAPERCSKIFDLFFSTKGSSGFGLWSARRIALKNQGDLMVVSEPGHGTTFTFLLPGVDE